ncbi:MAG: formate--tetrahydrofolate ligase [Moraxellaceae bacterium]|nr:formate--tetrahydrofolate ligase [Pseudobdellovibrionaceae bacterium]
MKKNIYELAHEINLNPEHLEPYGKDKAKVSFAALSDKDSKAKLILVSAITPTPAGEGKTTVSIGLAQGLKQAGYRAALALRQPSMGPVFGRKGTATGGGKSILSPAESINLHFTGDFHAIGSAHCLLAAAIDNCLHFKTSRLDPERVLWKRVLDMNDRALRRIQVGISEAHPSGRQSGFDITAASEIMAILCLSENYDDLKVRLNRIIVGFTPELEPVTAEEIRVTGSMLALLREALKPNLVQSIEGVPAFVHGGPFANIAHGCNSVLATRMALAHADYVVTEAGFAFDLGGEKFIDIKCRQSGLSPDVIVIVATIRALKMHGGVEQSELALENKEALMQGLQNLDAHLQAARYFNRPIVVALNRFSSDSSDELKTVEQHCARQNISCAVADVFGLGGAGALELSEFVVKACAVPTSALPFVYSLNDSPIVKIEKIAKLIYGASGVDLSAEAEAKLNLLQKNNLGGLPICMAKTHESISDNPQLRGRPENFRISIRDFEINHGAGFLVALTGKLLRMPALPRTPKAEQIQMDGFGNITGW